MSQDEVAYTKGTPTNVMEDDPSNPGFLRMIEVAKLDQGRTASDFPVWSYSLYRTWLRISFDACW